VLVVVLRVGALDGPPHDPPDRDREAEPEQRLDDFEPEGGEAED
jgi:hypothetical protein